MAEEKSFIEDAKSRLDRATEAWSDIYDNARSDLKFISGEPNSQWDDNAVEERRKQGLPSLQIDQLDQFVNMVANGIRVDTPTINVIPRSGGADVETAEMISGLIKAIEYNSRADSVYDYGALCAVRGSIGYIRVDHDYIDDESFDQEMLIKRVVNPLTVLLDPDSIEPDGSDAKFCFILETVSIAEYNRRFPNNTPTGLTQGDREKDWSKAKDGESITIAEYFYIDERDAEITPYGSDQIITDIEQKTRKVKKRVVKRCWIDGGSVLMETRFFGKYIPIVPIFGQELWVDGKRHLLSLIRKSKDGQKMFNYWKSTEAALLKRAPLSQYIAPAGAIENYADDYITPENSTVLRYDPVVDGQSVAPPQFVPPPPIPTGVVNAARSAVDDIKSTMGIYNASLGATSNEKSGIAIARRQSQGDLATFHFKDNLTRAITQVGRIIIEGLAEIYDTARALQIIGKDNNAIDVGINGMIVGDQERPYDLSRGKYSVRVTTGPSFITQRQEAADFYSQIITQQPQLIGIAGDLLFENTDQQGSAAIAARLKKTIDPKFLEDDKGQDQVAVAQIQQQQAIIQALTQKLQEANEKLNSKESDDTLKTQAHIADVETDRMKLEIEAAKLRLEEQKIVAETKLKSKELELKEAEIALKGRELRPLLDFGVKPEEEYGIPPYITGNQA